ncbi:hypothetical protein E1A91_D12G241800v1 [Gossypium mustelinum]|uniref:Isopenicillin N synthase-like Fe(2+) 2OG dioxygenase domain-containing protein n=1 Tax=Gossypium mustelinum TaxID=34275 RepID=A0A5D2SHD6_GOSMU|nr:hypothetical protein E1A91_D12G241800v1 [Gossypium mustelinum]
MNYYPHCAEASKVLGASPHFDATGLTLLLQVNELLTCFQQHELLHLMKKLSSVHLQNQLLRQRNINVFIGIVGEITCFNCFYLYCHISVLTKILVKS